jgi:hypothetical protein
MTSSGALNGMGYTLFVIDCGVNTVQGDGWELGPAGDLLMPKKVLLQARRLKIAPSLSEAGTLAKELANFKLKAVPAGGTP